MPEQAKTSQMGEDRKKGLLGLLVLICQLAKLVDQEDDYIRHFTQLLWLR